MVKMLISENAKFRELDTEFEYSTNKILLLCLFSADSTNETGGQHLG